MRPEAPTGALASGFVPMPRDSIGSDSAFRLMSLVVSYGERNDVAQRLALGREVPEELGQRLFDTAFSLFGEKGFERTTMDEIAATAGVARATLYYYFRGKDDLFVYLLDRGISMLGVMLGE